MYSTIYPLTYGKGSAVWLEDIFLIITMVNLRYQTTLPLANKETID